jgi:DNA-binding MarR family transcriptional regulator
MPDPTVTLIFLLRDTANLYSHYFQTVSADFAWSMTDCKILVWLQRLQGTSESNLAEYTEIDTAIVSRTIDHMVAHGIVARFPVPDNRRAHGLYLTGAAAPVLASIWLVLDRVLCAAFGDLKDEEARQLLKLLKKVHRNLTRLQGALK